MNNTLVNPTKKQWNALILCVIAGAIAPFLQYCLGTLTEHIMKTYNLSFTQISYINTTYALACGIGLFIVGAIVEKLGCKKWTMIGIALMIVGHGVFFYAPSYEFLLIARVISGFGNACIYNAAYTLAVHWFQGTNKMGVATGAMTAADGIGTFIALYIFALLMSYFGLSNGTAGTLVILTVVFVLLCIFLKDPGASSEVDKEVDAKDEFEAGKYTTIWNRNTIAHSLAVAGMLGGLGIANYWGPSMLTDMGVSTATSGLLSSLFTAVGIVSGLIFGAISDKLGKRRSPMLIGGVGMVVAYIFMIFGNMWNSVPLFTIALIACGFCGYVVYPIGFALISDTVVAKLVGPANGVIQGSSFLVGMLVFQQIVGVVKDATNSYWIGLAFCAALTVLLNVVGVMIFAKDKDTLLKERMELKKGI